MPESTDDNNNYRASERCRVGSLAHRLTVTGPLPSQANIHPPTFAEVCTLDTYLKGKGSPHAIIERRVPELIPVLGSQPAGDVNHKPDGRLPLLCTGPAVTPATLERAATSFAAW